MPEPLTTAIITTASSAIGSEIAGSIIEKAKEALETVSNNTSIRFRNVGQDLISQMEVSIEELVKQIGSQINQTVAELTDSLKVQLYNLSLATEKLLKATLDQLDNLSDEFVSDLRTTISRTWFMSEIYALDEIEGTLIPANQNKDWTIRVSGLNVGFDSEEIESVVRLKITIPNSPNIKQTGAEVSAHTVEFTLPIEIVEENRKQSSITILDAELIIKIKKDGILWFNDSFKGTQPFKILIAPKVAGRISVRGNSPKYDWVQRSDLDITYSNDLPSGHGTSSSDVVNHHISRQYPIARASVPPAIGDRRFYGAENGGCTGAGCSHLHAFSIKIINNGSTLDVYTHNNSHAITVRAIGRVERFEKTDDSPFELAPLQIESGKVIEVELPLNFETSRLTGSDSDFGIIDLVIERDPTTTVYPMPEGKFGGLNYLGSHVDSNSVIYRFARKD